MTSPPSRTALRHKSEASFCTSGRILTQVQWAPHKPSLFTAASYSGTEKLSEILGVGCAWRLRHNTWADSSGERALSAAAAECGQPLLPAMVQAQIGKQNGAQGNAMHGRGSPAAPALVSAGSCSPSAQRPSQTTGHVITVTVCHSHDGMPCQLMSVEDAASPPAAAPAPLPASAPSASFCHSLVVPSEPEIAAGRDGPSWRLFEDSSQRGLRKVVIGGAKQGAFSFGHFWLLWLLSCLLECLAAASARKLLLALPAVLRRLESQHFCNGKTGP